MSINKIFWELDTMIKMKMKAAGFNRVGIYPASSWTLYIFASKDAHPKNYDYEDAKAVHWDETITIHVPDGITVEIISDTLDRMLENIRS